MMGQWSGSGRITYGQADEAKVTDSLRHVGGVCVEGWLGVVVVKVDGGVSCDDQVRNREGE
jgi:hypothetical protein